MAILSAQADFTFEAYFTPVTGLVELEQHQIDPDTGSLIAESLSSWQGLAGQTWNDLSDWVTDTVPLRHTVSEIDLNTIISFTLDIESDIQGDVKYYIYVSDTGDFTGEETETLVQNGDTVDAFTGRYVTVQIFTTSGSIGQVTVTTNTAVFEQQITNIDTSTLGGTAAERTLELDNPVSGIIEMTIDVQDTTPYTQDVYVTDYPSSEVLIPIVKSKGSSPTFALYGLDNVPRDGIVDINIIAMPEMKMVGNNLLSNR
jgi:hypothetical protein